MRRSALVRVVLAASLALVSALIAVELAGASARSRTVLQFGDSLAVGTGLYLPHLLRGWHVTQSTDVSRHADAGPSGIRSFGSALPRVVVVSLGANDSPAATDWFAQQVRAVVRVAGPGRCVIWSSIVRPPYNGVSYDRLNGVLRRLDARYRNLVVFDWAALAARNPQWFGSDGVHPSAAGYRARAQAIARLVRTACS